MKQAVVTLENKKAGDVTLNKDVFGGEVRADLLARGVHYIRNKMRQGTHQTKDISMISGTGKKPFAQKGTGRARAGSLRSSHHRGGQTVFGPQSRSHATKLTKKMRQASLRSALASKVQSGSLIVVENLDLKSHKTKELAATLNKMDVKSALFVSDVDVPQNFNRAVRNIPHMSLMPVSGINVYDILRHTHLVVTKESVAKLEERLA